MAQLTVYMDEDTLRKIESAAHRSHESISRWVKKHLMMTLENKWPEHYFDLFGSLAKEKFERPAQGRFSDDALREKL